MKVLILGASYGSLLSTKLLMAGHEVTLVCLPEEVALINAEGTTVRINLRDEDKPRLLAFTYLSRKTERADPRGYQSKRIRYYRPSHARTAISG